MTRAPFDNPAGLYTDVPVLSNENVSIGDASSRLKSVYAVNIYADNIVGDPTLPNNNFLESVDAAGTGTVGLIKADATDNTVLNAATGKTVKVSFNSVTDITAALGSLTFASASQKIIPGATSLLFRNNADSATNLTIADAGAITTRGSILPDTTTSLNLGSGAAVWNNVYFSVLQFPVSSGKIVGGSSDTTFRDSTNASNNVIIFDNGDVSVSRQSSSVAQSVVTAISAAGTNSGNATALTGVTNHVTTAAAGTGVRLWSARTGSEIRVKNSGANTLLVYPDTGGTIDGGAGDAGVVIAVGAVGFFFKTAALTWVSAEAPAA